MAVVACVVALTTTVPAFAQLDTSALHRFVDESRADRSSALDALSRRINTAQLPLVARAVDRAEAREGRPLEGAYEAFSRWHFWQGRHWDLGHRGLWGVDPLWTPAAGGEARQASATLASLEILQLESLAAMALRRDLTFDALVWWTERRNLVRRIQSELYDPRTGGYADLDSVGRRVHPDALGGFLPLGLGADFLPSTSLDYARGLWYGDPEATEARRSTAALDRARQFLGRGDGQAVRLLPPTVSAALAREAAGRLMDVGLSADVRDALALVGLAARDSVALPMGSWELPLAVEDLGRESLGAATVALRFLWQGGFVPDEEIVALMARADSLTETGAPADAPLVEGLTDRLVQWRQRDFVSSRGAWRQRRAGRPDLRDDDSTFHYRDSGAGEWIDRALDLIAETVVAHHLRPIPGSRVRARLEPPLRGRGDSVELTLETGVTDSPDSDAAPSMQLMWTDGLRVLPPVELDFRATGPRAWAATVESVPMEEGLWWAILAGRPGPVRQAPALAVVEPVVAEVIALAPSRRRHPHRVRLVSQVETPVRGTVEIEVPLDWKVEPEPRITYALGPGESRELDVTLVPGPDSSPGHFDVTWRFYDGLDEIASQRSQGVRPFRWLALGPLPPSEPLPARPPAGVIPLDLSRARPGLDGEVRWQRLPGGLIGPRGEVRLGEDRDAVFYALTSFTTGSREGRVALDAECPFFLFVNGEEVLRHEIGGGSEESTVLLRSGANYVVVGVRGKPGQAPRFRLRMRDLDGQPLRGVDDDLEMLLDGYAYVQGSTADEDADPADVARATLRSVPISYVDPDAESVSVVGSFNGWSPARTPMTRDESGRWVARIRLRPGRFEYKFAVDGRNWIADPANPLAVADGFGGRNSVIVVE